ncbi:YaeQ family protein [Azonexus sp.]|uniref:YaeQ family protein n=1 Tax=Azonexus sp. TaxID=1872668 RepID=UPI0035AEB928
MALKSTVFKAELQVADLDRGHFADYPLTVARHPSENDERMMVRILAFALYAGPDLAFGKGLSSDDECALQEVDPSGVLQTWIEVGQPDETRIRKGCHRARRAMVLTYGGRSVDVWWQQIAPQLARFDNLTVLRLTAEETQALGGLASRSMQLSCTVQEGTVWLAAGERSLQLHPDTLLCPNAG